MCKYLTCIYTAHYTQTLHMHTTCNMLTQIQHITHHSLVPHMLFSTAQMPQKPCIPYIQTCTHTTSHHIPHNTHATPTANACRICAHSIYMPHNTHTPHILTTHTHSIRHTLYPLNPHPTCSLHIHDTPLCTHVHILPTGTLHTTDESAPTCASGPVSQRPPVLSDHPLGHCIMRAGYGGSQMERGMDRCQCFTWDQKQ